MHCISLLAWWKTMLLYHCLTNKTFWKTFLERISKIIWLTYLVGILCHLYKQHFGSLRQRCMAKMRKTISTSSVEEDINNVKKYLNLVKYYAIIYRYSCGIYLHKMSLFVENFHIQIQIEISICIHVSLYTKCFKNLWDKSNLISFFHHIVKFIKKKIIKKSGPRLHTQINFIFAY